MPPYSNSNIQIPISKNPHLSNTSSYIPLFPPLLIIIHLSPYPFLPNNFPPHSQHIPTYTQPSSPSPKLFPHHNPHPNYYHILPTISSLPLPSFFFLILIQINTSPILTTPLLFSLSNSPNPPPIPSPHHLLFSPKNLILPYFPPPQHPSPLHTLISYERILPYLSFSPSSPPPLTLPIFLHTHFFPFPHHKTIFTMNLSPLTLSQ